MDFSTSFFVRFTIHDNSQEPTKPKTKITKHHIRKKESAPTFSRKVYHAKALSNPPVIITNRVRRIKKESFSRDHKLLKARTAKNGTATISSPILCCITPSKTTAERPDWLLTSKNMRNNSAINQPKAMMPTTRRNQKLTVRLFINSILTFQAKRSNTPFTGRGRTRSKATHLVARALSNKYITPLSSTRSCCFTSTAKPAWLGHSCE